MPDMANKIQNTQINLIIRKKWIISYYVIYVKKKKVVYLQFTLNWIFCILLGSSSPRSKPDEY